ncbi:M20/M25/M40 family metallo-hydrolase [Cryptosporangium phraense]|uniref:M20/M25/M40 family metallo-hydrolase n=1 Tax=Cryptosporangium phraense TaxID=2593070 RepID=A0A545AJL5_9ACTN|nr:M20/M25/M40 family metallo-hydrolase [Cryptosporangium phraense]TQS40915.1 M20/M25/M40 family metallo-hydrolase [Cryptosporangium phraense]
MVPEPVELLRRLIRVDTTNPPGNESALVEYLGGLLRDGGVTTTVVGENLVARVPGRGEAPPLLMQGHLDVVPVSDHGWTHPPFSGDLIDGFVWGRGALDMKSGVVMMLVGLLRMLDAGRTPPGDVILALLADEEAGGERGAKYLVENRPELFEGVRYAIGEFGGFTMEIAGRRFYPVQVAEKQICWVRAVLRAPGGHGSLARPGGVTARLATVLRTLDRQHLPVHVTPVVRTMISAMAAELPAPAAQAARLLLRPALTDRLLGAAGETGLTLAPLFHHTATPNIVSASGGAINVRPTEAVLDLDGRLLPGFRPQDFLAELHAFLGDDVELSVVRHDPVELEPNLGLFDTLASVLRDHDPLAKPVPMLMPASTDGRFFARLGIQTYGFTPMTLPASMTFTKLVHGVDERIPASAVEFGTACVTSLLERFR